MSVGTTKTQAACIAMALGDAGGVGPEVTLKAIASEAEVDETRYLLLGDERLRATLSSSLGRDSSWERFQRLAEKKRVSWHNPLSEPLPAGLPTGSPEAARAALEWLREGARLCLRGEADALVTAPVNKESIIRSGEKNFIGQTELLSALAG